MVSWQLDRSRIKYKGFKKKTKINAEGQMEKVWLDQYQKAIPHEVKTIHPSITAYFDDTVVKYKDRPAFACLGKTLSFDQLRETVETIANWFQNELGIKKGDKVALMMPNLLQYPTALFGALKAGATVVNVNPLYTPRELEHQLKDSGAETIVILANFAKTLETVLPNVQMKNVIITEMGDLLGFPKGPLINFVIKKIKKMVPEYNIPRVIAFKELLKPRTTEFKPVTVNEDDIAFLQYTGGTTGASKGAILTHKNVCINFTQAQQFLQERMTPETDIIITALPIYHIFSLVCNCMMFMNQGALNVLIPNPRDMDGFVKELGKWKFTSISAVNTLFNGFCVSLIGWEFNPPIIVKHQARSQALILLVCLEVINVFILVNHEPSDCTDLFEFL